MLRYAFGKGARMSSEVIKRLNDLISTLRDSEEALEKAAKGAHADDARLTFDAIAVKRRNFASEISEVVRRLGAEPAELGHGGGPLSAGWVDVEARIRPKSDAEFLADIQKGEMNLLRHYEHALATDLPGDVRVIVDGQYQSAVDTIRQLRRMEKVNRAG
jgi:uncharacterized protein (TIGR02284 family)